MYEHDQFQAWKMFYNLEVRPRGYKTWVQSQTKIKRKYWLLADTIIALYFEFEIELKCYNLRARLIVC